MVWSKQLQKPSEQSKKLDDTLSAVKACLLLMMINLLRCKELDDNFTADVPKDSTNHVQNDASTTDVLAEEYAPVENSITNVTMYIRLCYQYKGGAIYCY